MSISSICLISISIYISIYLSIAFQSQTSSSASYHPLHIISALEFFELLKSIKLSISIPVINLKSPLYYPDPIQLYTIYNKISLENLLSLGRIYENLFKEEKVIFLNVCSFSRDMRIVLLH